MATPGENETLLMDGWPLGVNNRLRETEAGQSTQNRNKINSSLYLREAINVDLTRLGHPLRRKGYSLIQAGYTHSLWSHKELAWGLCVHAGWLQRVESTGEMTQLVEVAPYRYMTYTTVNGKVYWSNGADKGCVTDYGVSGWGMPEPESPECTIVAGALYPGLYKVAAVWVDDQLEEYGASDTQAIKVADTEAIQITPPTTWPQNAYAYRVFVSQPNGEQLYHIADRYNTTPVHISIDELGKGRELETTDLKQVPAGNIVRYFNGRIYVARRNYVTFTEPLRYGLTRPAQGIYMFPSDVVLLEPAIDGIYVGTKKGVVFIAGTDPYDVRQTNVLTHSPVSRAVTRVPGEYFEVDDEDVAVWWGSDGAMVAGLAGGRVQQLSKDKIANPSFQAGAMLYRETEGMVQVVSSLTKGGQSSGMAATDSVVASIRQNTKQLN